MIILKGFNTHWCTMANAARTCAIDSPGAAAVACHLMAVATRNLLLYYMNINGIRCSGKTGVRDLWRQAEAAQLVLPEKGAELAPALDAFMECYYSSAKQPGHVKLDAAAEMYEEFNDIVEKDMLARFDKEQAFAFPLVKAYTNGMSSDKLRDVHPLLQGAVNDILNYVDTLRCVNNVHIYGEGLTWDCEEHSTLFVRVEFKEGTTLSDASTVRLKIRTFYKPIDVVENENELPQWVNREGLWAYGFNPFI